MLDKDKSIINAIHQEFPMFKLFYCWNHVFRDVRLWCRTHGAPSSDIAIYVDYVQQLFHSSSKEEYEKKFANRREVWDIAFESYYMGEIHPDCVQVYWEVGAGRVSGSAVALPM